MFRPTSNYRYICAIIFILCFAAVRMQAQVTVDAKLDSASIFIGQRIGMTLEVTADAKKKVQLPEWDSLQQVVPGVEFVRAEKPDTSFLDDGRRMVLNRRYYFTSFDSALYLMPEMQVEVDGKVYPSKKMALKVLTFDVDTLHADSIFGMKPELAPPFDWAEWRLVIIGIVMALLIVAMLVYVCYRLKNNKPILRRIRHKKHVPPHTAAMKKIEIIKERFKEVTMELNFVKSGDYYIPDIKLKKPNIRLGKWGRMRKEYLRLAQPIIFSDMVLSETLYEHCVEVESAAKSRMNIILPNLMEYYGVTEKLKAENQIEWVRQMNACVAQAEEAIKGELIYAD